MPTTPVPAVEGWFTTDDEPRLLGTRCTTCGTVFFPQATGFCRNPDCRGREFDEVELSRTGHGLELHRRPVPAAAALHPDRATSTSRSPSPPWSWPTSSWWSSARWPRAYGVDDLSRRRARWSSWSRPLYELDGVPAPHLPVEADRRRWPE